MTQTSAEQIAPTSRRAVAYLIDALIAGALSTVLMIVLVVAAMAAGSDMIAVIAVGSPLVGLVLLAWMLVYTFMQSGAGSIGMRAQGLRLARASDGAPLGFGMALLRNIVFGLAASIVVGYFTPLFDGTGRFQGWHDKAAGSLMLDVRSSAAVVAPAAAASESSLIPPRPPLPEQMPEPTFGTAPTAPVIPPRPPLPERPAAPAAAETPAPAPDQAAAPAEDLIAFVPGITQEPPAPQTAGEQAVEPAPASEPVGESDDLEETRISVPGHRLVFTWDDGSRVTVSRRTLFGRNPAPEDGAVVVPVRDETLSLSKTHFEAGAEASGGWIVDRHSTNGTTIVRDGQRIACPPGVRIEVRLGDAVEIGDRIVTIGGYA